MKELVITINIENDAFISDMYREALRAITESMSQGSSIIHDINGNRVGLIEIKYFEQVSIPMTLLKDVVMLLNQIPNKRVKGLTHGKDSYEIVSILENWRSRYEDKNK